MRRRQFLKASAALAVGSSIPIAALPAFASIQIPQTPFPGTKIPKFVEPVPTFVGNRVPGTSIVVNMQEFQQKILPESLYSSLKHPFNEGSYVWGYKVGNKSPLLPGYTIE